MLFLYKYMAICSYWIAGDHMTAIDDDFLLIVTIPR